MSKLKKMTAEDQMVEATKVTPPSGLIKKIVMKAEEGAAKLSEIGQVEEYLKGLNREYQAIIQTDIPNLMSSAGMDEIKLKDGTKVTIKDILWGSLPKDEEARTKALDWISMVGAGEIIKEEIEMAFGRGSRKEATKVKAALAKLKVDFTAKESVHAETLKSFARERLAKGETVPMELLGLGGGRVAKIDLPKKGGKK